MKKTDYGKSDHYLGMQGNEYFQWQNNLGGFERGLIESRKFQPFINKKDYVMDFGCGGGHVLAALNCRKKCGVEVNPSAREEAEKYDFPVYEDCSYIKKKSIDKVISNHCLEHIPCPIEALRQIRECLVPNGKLILCIPIDDWRTEKYFHKDDINHHLYTWTPQLIGNSLLEAGFQIDKIYIYAHAWPPKFLILNTLLPVWLFDIICSINSIIFKRRQILAIATNKNVIE
jgi:SAM-dependent methyltransferase